MTQNTRSDESIKSHASQVLSRCPYVDATDVEVIVESGFVNLKGTVRDKQQQKTYITIDRKNGLIGNVNNDLNMI